MKLTCGATFAKYFLLITCAILLLMSLALLGVSIWVVVDVNNFQSSMQKIDDKGAKNDFEKFGSDQLQAAAIATLCFSAFLALIGFLGCCGAMKEWKILLFIFALILTVILIAILVLAVYILVRFGTDVEKTVKKIYAEVEEAEKNAGTVKNKTLTALLEEFSEKKCCGGTHPDSVDCALQQSCPDWLAEFIQKYILPVGIIGIVIVVTLLLGITLSCCLFQALRSAEHTV